MLQAFFVAFAACLVLCVPVLAMLGHFRVLDRPSVRSSHAVATPRGGGAAVVAALLIALGLSNEIPSVPATALAVAVIGFGLLGIVDDLRPVPARLRLALQGLLALLPLPWLLDGLSGAPTWQAVFSLGVWLWLVAYVNAFNFMDGINGIAAAQAIIAGAAWWYVGDEYGVPSLALGGALLVGTSLGFLPYNFPRARMFLGDVGSYALGAWIAVLVVIALRAGVSPVAALAPVSIALADTATVIVRRARHGEQVFDAHRTHAYQRLCSMGWSHSATTVFVGAVVLCCSAVGVAAIGGDLTVQLATGLVVLLIDAGYVASPSLMARRAQHRGPPE